MAIIGRLSLLTGITHLIKKGIDSALQEFDFHLYLERGSFTSKKSSN